MNKVFLFVINDLDFLISHRLAICTALQNKGYTIHVAAPFSQSGKQKIDEKGYIFHNINFSRKSKNPFTEIHIIFHLVKLLKKISPEIVHLITIKPYLYGGIAARLTKIPAVVSAVSGLGILFSSTNIKYKILRKILYPFFYLAFNHKNQKIIFQNDNDYNLLKNLNIIDVNKAVFTKGSGIDIRLYPFLPEPDQVPTVVMASRLLIDKGVKTFIDAASILRKKNIKFLLIGTPDPGSDNSVDEKELIKCHKKGIIDWLGYQRDVPYFFSQANIITLPSFYGEGIPKVLLEAAACGRAVITTDHPGCKDAIKKNVSGLLVTPKSPQELANAIDYLINNPQIRYSMGSEGRKFAQEEFLIEIVANKHLEIYEELTNAGLN